VVHIVITVVTYFLGQKVELKEESSPLFLHKLKWFNKQFCFHLQQHLLPLENAFLLTGSSFLIRLFSVDIEYKV
jgi:hypothetical protein